MRSRDLVLILGAIGSFGMLMPPAHAFSTVSSSESAVTRGAPLADPDDRLKSMFGDRDEDGAGSGAGTLPMVRPLGPLGTGPAIGIGAGTVPTGNMLIGGAGRR